MVIRFLEKETGRKIEKIITKLLKHLDFESTPHQVTDASSKIRFKKTPYGTEGTVKQHKHRHTHNSICTIHMDLIL